MDNFDVPSKEADIVRTSHIVEEMKAQAADREVFPVLLGTHIAEFHDVYGGYVSSGYHLVNFVHEVQGIGSPFQGDVYQESVEAHLDDYFYVEVEDVREYDNYPDEDYVLSLQVDGYQRGPYSFSEEMSADADNRETEYTYES